MFYLCFCVVEVYIVELLVFILFNEFFFLFSIV